jgi:peptide/nickel transport system ATP-binding protein
MYRGKIVEHGRVWDIFAKPKHPYTKGLMTCRPPLTRRLTYLPIISDFMDEKQDENGKWIVTEKSHASMKEMLSGSAESLDEHIRRVKALQRQEPILSVRHLKTYFPGKRDFFGRTLSWTKAVDDVSFDVYPGETLGLVGESGCGKTTLARTVLRLIEPTDGQIFFKGQDLIRLGKEELRRLREQIQIIFQDPYSSLNPRMTIGAILTEPMKVHGMFNSKGRRLDRAVEIMEKVGMDASYLVRYPHEFSGGQRQRICIARALVLEPNLLICDEPVSALDVSIQAQVLNLLSHLKRELNLTYIFISHDLAVVKFMSDRIMVMNMGKTEEIGPAEEIYNNPQRNYTKKLIAATPVGSLEDIRRQQSNRGRLEVGSH